MDLVIRNGISDNTGEALEVGITDGVIVALAPSGLPPGDQEIDAGGGMISPAFIESHFHLENAFCGMVQSTKVAHLAGSHRHLRPGQA